MMDYIRRLDFDRRKEIEDLSEKSPEIVMDIKNNYDEAEKVWDKRMECSRRLEYSRGQDSRGMERGDGGQCEKSWEQLRNSRGFIKETKEK